MKITKASFGALKDGSQVDLYTMTNDNGMVVQITNYGGIITSIKVPDNKGNIDEVTLGYDNLDSYVKRNPFFGAIVGRYGNRIANGEFTIDGTTYPLVKNNGPNHLHGGTIGFDKVVWAAKELNKNDLVGIELEYTSKDMEEGYPGTLQTKVVYTLNNENELKIEYLAETDKATHVNLTNHAYFNLKDGGATQHTEHIIKINADFITPVDETLIPTGELMSVEGTPFDFRQPTAIGDRIDAADEQIQFGGGYDHNFVINGKAGELRLCAEVKEPTSGRIMQVFSTEPGVQFYTGNFLGSIAGIGGKVYQKRHGFCLETQHYPNTPNQPEFPTTLLRPGKIYKTTTVFRFAHE